MSDDSVYTAHYDLISKLLAKKDIEALKTINLLADWDILKIKPGDTELSRKILDSVLEENYEEEDEDIWENTVYTLDKYGLLTNEFLNSYLKEGISSDLPFAELVKALEKTGYIIDINIKKEKKKN